MIRTTREASMFGLWRNVSALEKLVKPEHLTTARYEPVSRNALGSGIVDLLFESAEESCVIAAIRLDPNSLVTRERSPFIWPEQVAGLLDPGRLVMIETHLTPWLRSLARGRPMARESVRRFAPSQRFERARAAELLGAAPLEQVMRRMAPFIYARRFAARSRVLLDCADEALGCAVLADLAASIGYREGRLTHHEEDDREFARAWYGTRARGSSAAPNDLVVVGNRGTADAPVVDASVVIETSSGADAGAVIIDVPSPAPLDLLFSFDGADAPVVSRFAVYAREPSLRDRPGVNRPNVVGGSAGRIVLALSAEALAMRGADVDEIETLKQCLAEEGLTVSIVTAVSDPLTGAADLVHIFGSAFEPHTIAFAENARSRGVDFIFDVAPRPQDPSGYIENMLVVALRAGSDDAETARYLRAYEERRAAGSTTPEPSAEEYARCEKRFAELALSAVAVLATEEDVADLRASVPASVSGRVLVRGVFSAPEPSPAAIGHLVPSAPFAFVHCAIAARSHALFAAFAAQSSGVPLVIAGPCYDVEYLQTLRTIASSAFVLADPEAEVVAAIYRRAAIWIDAAPRPRSAAGLLRAVACGALPVIAIESPLARVAGPDAPTFQLTSLDNGTTAIVDAMALSNRPERLAALQARLGPRRDLASSFGALMAAYARVASTV